MVADQRKHRVPASGGPPNLSAGVAGFATMTLLERLRKRLTIAEERDNFARPFIKQLQEGTAVVLTQEELRALLALADQAREPSA